MNNLSLKTSMIGAFALMLTIAGVTTPSTYATMPMDVTATTAVMVDAQINTIEVPTMSISAELINLIAAGDLKFPFVHKYCPIPTSVNRNYVGDREQGIDIKCKKSYYQKLITATNTKIEKTLRSYENKYPVIKKRLQVIQNAIEYAETQMNNTNKVSKKVAYDAIRLALYDYVISLYDEQSDDVSTTICDIFKDDGFCDDGIITLPTDTVNGSVETNTNLNTQPEVIGNNNARIYISSVSYDTSNHNISVTTCEQGMTANNPRIKVSIGNRVITDSVVSVMQGNDCRTDNFSYDPLQFTKGDGYDIVTNVYTNNQYGPYYDTRTDRPIVVRP